jgi:hypothetical protein
VIDPGVDGLEVAALVVRLLHHAREGCARLHRSLDVDDGCEWLVVDGDHLGAVLGGRLGLGDDQRERLPGEDDLLAREWFRSSIRALRREREIGGDENRDDTGNRERCLLVHASDSGVHLGGEDGARVQQAVDVPVRGVAGRARHLLRRVDTGPGDAYECFAHQSSLARCRARASARSARVAASSRR